MRHPSPGDKKLRLSVLCVLVAIGGSSYAQVEDEGGGGFLPKLRDRLHISGYGNVHYMNHDGVVNFINERDLNNGLLQLREFSLFVDLDITDNISASIEPAVANNEENFSVNYAYVDFDIGGGDRRVGRGENWWLQNPPRKVSHSFLELQRKQSEL